MARLFVLLVLAAVVSAQSQPTSPDFDVYPQESGSGSLFGYGSVKNIMLIVLLLIGFSYIQFSNDWKESSLLNSSDLSDEVIETHSAPVHPVADEVHGVAPQPKKVKSAPKHFEPNKPKAPKAARKKCSLVLPREFQRGPETPKREPEVAPLGRGPSDVGNLVVDLKVELPPVPEAQKQADDLERKCQEPGPAKIVEIPPDTVTIGSVSVTSGETSGKRTKKVGPAAGGLGGGGDTSVTPVKQPKSVSPEFKAKVAIYSAKRKSQSFGKVEAIQLDPEDFVILVGTKNIDPKYASSVESLYQPSNVNRAVPVQQKLSPVAKDFTLSSTAKEWSPVQPPSQQQQQPPVQNTLSHNMSQMGQMPGIPMMMMMPGQSMPTGMVVPPGMVVVMMPGLPGMAPMPALVPMVNMKANMSNMAMANQMMQQIPQLPNNPTDTNNMQQQMHQQMSQQNQNQQQPRAQNQTKQRLPIPKRRKHDLGNGMAAVASLMAAAAAAAAGKHSGDKDDKDSQKRLFVPAFVPVKPIPVMCKFAYRCSRADCQFTHPLNRRSNQMQSTW